MIPFDKVIVNGQVAEAFQSWEHAPHPGVFTSFRALIQNGNLCVLGLSLHYERLLLGSQRLGLPNPNATVISTEILCGMGDLKLLEARVRIEIFRDLRITRITSIQPWSLDCPIIKMQTCQLSRPYEDLKSSYGAELSERSQLVCEKSCEMLYTDQAGFIIEGAWSNFGWIQSDGVICFTGRGLDGVTQRVITDLLFKAGKHVCITGTTVESLAAQKVTPFITSALRGIVFVQKIDGVSFSSIESLTNLRRMYVEAT